MAAVLFAALAVVAIADIIDPNRPGLLVLVAVPLVAAIMLKPRATATISGVSTLLALTLPGSLYEAGAVRFVRVAAVAGLSVLAVAASVWRQRLILAHSELVTQRAAMERDRREALEVNDAILQEVFAARMWLDLGREAEANMALGRALESTRNLVGGLLGDERAPRPGDLVREQGGAGSPLQSV